MARITGPLQFSGTIGNIIFYQTKNGCFAKLKPHFDRKRFEKDPAFASQRKNMAELGRCSKASKLVRQAFANPLCEIAGSNVFNRLNKVMINVIKGDKTNEWGRRHPTDGDITLLGGFEFNENSPLRNSSFFPYLPAYTANIDRKTGTMAISFPRFRKKNMAAMPRNATHFKLQATGAALNFEHTEHIHAIAQSANFPVKGDLPDQFTLQVSLLPGSQHPLLLALSISFLQECNGEIRPLNSFMHNAMALVKVCSL